MKLEALIHPAPQKQLHKVHIPPPHHIQRPRRQVNQFTDAYLHDDFEVAREEEAGLAVEGVAEELHIRRQLRGREAVIELGEDAASQRRGQGVGQQACDDAVLQSGELRVDSDEGGDEGARDSEGLLRLRLAVVLTVVVKDEVEDVGDEAVGKEGELGGREREAAAAEFGEEGGGEKEGLGVAGGEHGEKRLRENAHFTDLLVDGRLDVTHLWREREERMRRKINIRIQTPCKHSYKKVQLYTLSFSSLSVSLSFPTVHSVCMAADLISLSPFSPSQSHSIATHTPSISFARTAFAKLARFKSASGPPSEGSASASTAQWSV